MLVFGNKRLMATFKEIDENKCFDERHPFVKGHNLTNMRDNWG